MSKSKKIISKSSEAKREYVSQSDVPAYSLDQAIRIPTAIVENYANGPVTPLQLADAMLLSPTSSNFRQLCGASIAYGLTEGGYNAAEIKLTALARRILEPLEEGDEILARREAILRPRVIREFLEKYRSCALPRNDIAENVISSMGIPKEKADSVLALIIECAQIGGFLREIKGKQYVDLGGVETRVKVGTDAEFDGDEQTNCEIEDIKDSASNVSPLQLSDRTIAPLAPTIESNRRVFITHGKNREFVEPIKKLLGFGELIPVVSVERQSVSKPVPDKVMDDMRSCSAAIIHVDGEQAHIDKEGTPHSCINPNVLIEIGAAFALYGRRFILLVHEGVRLPSNLQGLFEVRYSGDSLDGDAAIRLMEAINDIKKNAVPAREDNSSEKAVA